MPEPDRSKLKPDVEKYLERCKVEPSRVGPHTRRALNSLTPGELDALYRVGEALTEDGTPLNFAAHIH